MIYSKIRNKNVSRFRNKNKKYCNSSWVCPSVCHTFQGIFTWNEYMEVRKHRKVGGGGGGNRETDTFGSWCNYKYLNIPINFTSLTCSTYVTTSKTSLRAHIIGQSYRRKVMCSTRSPHDKHFLFYYTLKIESSNTLILNNNQIII
jgi:hypothetical protein